MRSSVLLSAALAAVATASPVDKRAEVLVTQTDITYVTDIVTVTAGQPIPTTSAPPAAQNQYPNHAHATSWLTSYYVVPSSAPEAPPAAAAPADPQAPPAQYSSPQNTPTTQAQSPTEASAAMATTYQEAVVNHHNYHRFNHSAPDVTWDDDLASAALTLAQGCIWGVHNVKIPAGSYSGYGQNMGAGVTPGNVGDMITNSWYNGEISEYTYYGGETENYENAIHATEVIWVATTKVGCATNYCSGNTTWFTICNYYPAGNFLGHYAQNVLAPKGEASIVGSYNVNSQEIESSYDAGH